MVVLKVLIKEIPRAAVGESENGVEVNVMRVAEQAIARALIVVPAACA